MSIEELKIREELELEVENDLEEEIKDGIYRLAMKLHELYQHRRERSQRTTKQSSNQQNKQRKSRKTMLSEINIIIKMEGGARIQIKEIKKEAGGRGRLIPIRSTPIQVQSVRGKTTPPLPRNTKFDWTQSLRSKFNTLSTDSSIEGKNRDKVHRNEGNASIRSRIALLEMGWKY